MNIIVATCLNDGIGYKNSLPWNFRSDLKYFAKLTKGQGNNAIVMGKNTWNSLPFHPLPKRENLILSTTLNKENNKNSFKNIKDLKEYINNSNYDDVWIIGGSNIYKQFINDKDVHKIYITKIMKEYECDTFFPKFSDDYKLIETTTQVENDVTLEFKIYERIKYMKE
tara:strand:- start:1545 stop:2048 length:504 start_codon:yes stop_codon:yes gene_type:complete